jgi:ribonuclease H / adenosylcobalamin/alpha-ribazole phosphatase
MFADSWSVCGNMIDSEIKKRIQDAIFSRLSSVSGVLSTTLVGSFIDRDDLAGISDIDTIVVCEKLNNVIFKQCNEQIKSIDMSACGLKGYQLKINTSFGPLKFDEQKLAVIHLMVYDIKGHRKHVIASPFTCLDWERSNAFKGISLRSIFPVGNLQPRDFIEARRGVGDYLTDLNKGVISIRDYEFSGDSVSEVKRVHPLDDRHRGEYAYHIVRNLVQNGLKLMNGENKLYSLEKLEQGLEILMESKASVHLNKFKEISKLKKERSTVYPEWTLSWVSTFIKDFQESVISRWGNAQKISFMRHAQTALNDGTFLGQGRDPGILHKGIPGFQENNIKTVYSSPAKRCVETAKLIFPQVTITKDNRLKEINYASAEGMTFETLKKQHPKIIDEWSKGEDPNFPDGGENTSGVFSRLNKFLGEISGKIEGETAVMTHNVVLRCLIGKSHSIPQQDWHLLSIPHAEPLEFKTMEGRLISNIPRSQLGNIFADLGKV